MTDPLRGNMQPHHSSGVKYDPTRKYFSRIEKRYDKQIDPGDTRSR